MIDSILSVENNRRSPVIESEPRAVPYREAQPDAHLSAEICPGAAPGAVLKTTFDRVFSCFGHDAVRNAAAIAVGQQSRKNGVAGDCI